MAVVEEPRYVVLAPRGVLLDDAADRLIRQLRLMQKDLPDRMQYAVVLGEDGLLHFVLVALEDCDEIE
jgi:hypothetical protein